VRAIIDRRAELSSGGHHKDPLGQVVKLYTLTMSWQERISVEPLVRSGKPHIKGTRITAYDVLEYLAGGMSENGASRTPYL
jgi:Protein of unknown function (DUF433)